MATNVLCPGPQSGSIPEGCQKVAGGRDRNAVEYPRSGAMATNVFDPGGVAVIR